MGSTVLVVEDDALLRNGMMTLLTMQGHRVAVAANVAEAAAYLDVAMPTHLLLDLNLPDGTGIEILKLIRAQALPVRIAIVSGGFDIPLVDTARALGIDTAFSKPPDWDKVLEWVAQT